MTGQLAQPLGSQTSPGNQAPGDVTTTEAAPARREKREATADFLSYTLSHLCIKVVWLGVLQVMAGFEPIDWAAIGFGALSLILIFTDICLQFQLLEAIDEVDPRPRRFRVGSGMSLTVAYLVACLPFATSLYACLWLLVGSNFVFTVGCAVEMRFELFRRAVDVLVDGLGDGDGYSVSWEVPDEVQIAMMAGVIGGVTCFLCSLMCSNVATIQFTF